MELLGFRQARYMSDNKQSAPLLSSMGEVVVSHSPLPACDPFNLRTTTGVQRRLPGSNLLFGLPVVMDTNDETIKEGSKVRASVTSNNSDGCPVTIMTINSMAMCNRATAACRTPCRTQFN